MGLCDYLEGRRRPGDPGSQGGCCARDGQHGLGGIPMQIPSPFGSIMKRVVERTGTRNQEASQAPPPATGSPRAEPRCPWLRDPSAACQDLFVCSTEHPRQAACKPACEPQLQAASARVCSGLPLLPRLPLAPSTAHKATWRCPLLPAPREDARPLAEVLL